MKKWLVTLEFTEQWQTNVEARSQDEAEELAQQDWGDDSQYRWSCVDMEVQSISAEEEES